MSAERWLVASLGDPAGIGPEVLLKAALRWRAAGSPAALAVTAPAAVLRAEAARLGIVLPILEAECLPEDPPDGLLALGWGRSPAGPPVAPEWDREKEPSRAPGVEGGRVAWASLADAVDLVLEDSARRALVTAPVCKESLALAGFRWPGHTEFLGERCGVADPLMWLTSPRLSVGLVSNHDPLARVAGRLDPTRVEAKIRLASAWMERRCPGEELVVLSVNPHAGDGGVLGGEEREWLGPLCVRLREAGFILRGPLPADTALARGEGRFLAMYHDQGLPVFKLVAGSAGVNTTLGLTLTRTSPDHGTAFDVAGRGVADEGSMVSALEEALLQLEGGSRA